MTGYPDCVFVKKFRTCQIYLGMYDLTARFEAHPILAKYVLCSSYTSADLSKKMLIQQSF